MTTLYVVLAILLSVICVASAAADVTRQPRVVETLQRLGFDHLLPFLATVKTLAAVGLLVGLALRPLGAVTAAALAIYFMLAAVLHVRAGDKVGESAPPAVLSLTSALCLLAAVGS